MTSAHALELANVIIRNDLAVSGSLLILLNAFLKSRGDPLGEVMTQDVMMFLYAKTDHCEEAMREFISQGEAHQSPRAA